MDDIYKITGVGSWEAHTNDQSEYISGEGETMYIDGVEVLPDPSMMGMFSDLYTGIPLLKEGEPLPPVGTLVYICNVEYIRSGFYMVADPTDTTIASDDYDPGIGVTQSAIQNPRLIPVLDYYLSPMIIDSQSLK